MAEIKLGTMYYDLEVRNRGIIGGGAAPGQAGGQVIGSTGGVGAAPVAGRSAQAISTGATLGAPIPRGPAPTVISPGANLEPFTATGGYNWRDADAPRPARRRSMASGPDAEIGRNLYREGGMLFDGPRPQPGTAANARSAAGGTAFAGPGTYQPGSFGFSGMTPSLVGTPPAGGTGPTLGERMTSPLFGNNRMGNRIFMAAMFGGMEINQASDAYAKANRFATNTNDLFKQLDAWNAAIERIGSGPAMGLALMPGKGLGTVANATGPGMMMAGTMQAIGGIGLTAAFGAAAVKQMGGLGTMAGRLTAAGAVGFGVAQIAMAIPMLAAEKATDEAEVAKSAMHLADTAREAGSDLARGTAAVGKGGYQKALASAAAEKDKFYASLIPARDQALANPLGGMALLEIRIAKMKARQRYDAEVGAAGFAAGMSARGMHAEAAHADATRGVSGDDQTYLADHDLLMAKQGIERRKARKNMSASEYGGLMAEQRSQRADLLMGAQIAAGNRSIALGAISAQTAFYSSVAATGYVSYGAQQQQIQAQTQSNYLGAMNNPAQGPAFAFAALQQGVAQSAALRAQTAFQNQQQAIGFGLHTGATSLATQQGSLSLAAAQAQNAAAAGAYQTPFGQQFLGLQPGQPGYQQLYAAKSANLLAQDTAAAKQIGFAATQYNAAIHSNLESAGLRSQGFDRAAQAADIAAQTLGADREAKQAGGDSKTDVHRRRREILTTGLYQLEGLKQNIVDSGTFEQTNGLLGNTQSTGGSNGDKLEAAIRETNQKLEDIKTELRNL